MSRPRFALILTLVASLCLALAAGAAAKPHHASPLAVDAPTAANLPVGIPTKVKVKVANHGKAPIAKVTLVASHSKEVRVAPGKAKIGTLRPHKSKAATFTVTVTAAGKSTLEFVAKAPHQAKAHDAVALKVSGAPPKEEAKKAPDIVGRYFWNSYQVLTTTYMHAYYFVDEHFVYRGVPKEGPPACSAQTTFNDDDDGCIPYTWDESTGALTIGSAGGDYKVGSHGLKVGDESFSEAQVPEAGTKFDASGSYINQFGICPISCSFVTVDLQMSSGGEFARASGVSGFFGEGGSYGALPPEDHGTYSIDPRGRITFSYADGHVATETIVVMLDNSDNADPNYGILLGESVYFGPHSDV
jgi:prepilin-type processing-associated H-X9-DG protein